MLTILFLLKWFGISMILDYYYSTSIAITIIMKQQIASNIHTVVNAVKTIIEGNAKVLLSTTFNAKALIKYATLNV